MKNFILSIFFLLSIILSADIFGRPVDDTNGNNCYTYSENNGEYKVDPISRRREVVWLNSTEIAYQKKWVLTCGRRGDEFYAEQLAKEKSRYEEEAKSLRSSLLKDVVGIWDALKNQVFGGSRVKNDREQRLSEIQAAQDHQSFFEAREAAWESSPCNTHGWGPSDYPGCNDSGSRSNGE